MNAQEFKNSLSQDMLPNDISAIQAALWHAAKGNWEEAHIIAQEHEGEKIFDHLHAYLHRLEGDDWNANYWYKRAGEKMPVTTTENELELLITKWVS